MDRIVGPQAASSQASGNSNSSSTSSTPTTLPYAPTTVDAGSAATATAPNPGQSGKNYGPDDGYHASDALKGATIVGGTTLFAVAGGIILLGGIM